MLMLKRLGLLLVVVATVPLITGGGGMGPGQPGARKVTGPAVTATVVIDPHMSGVTLQAKRATIRLEKGSLASTASFDIPSTFVLNRGCDLHLTDLRFVYVPITRPNTLYGWVPFAVVDALFTPLGIAADAANNVPVITDVDNDVCTADPANPGVPDGTGVFYASASPCPDGNPCTNPNNQNIFANGGDGRPALAGILSFTAVIQFEVAQQH
jgi:hypothetical protein